MSDCINGDQNIEILFCQLVMSLHADVMQHLGKIKNPVSGKIEPDLEKARQALDMLVMIRNKTRGNLTEDENQLLERLINEAEINYQNVIKKIPNSRG